MKLQLVIKIFSLSVLFLLGSFSMPKYVSAQYGSYGCFGSGASGGCQTSLSSTCTNGGVIPNPSGCNGLDPSACNSASFSCQAPPADSTCTTAADCPTFFNCVGSVCVPSGGGGGGSAKSGPSLEGCASGGKGIDTAIGCIPIDSEDGLAKFFLTWGMGLGGGIALILIVVASFMIMTSAGDPKKLMAGKELLTSAVSGLIVLVFAAYILNLVGVELLGIFSGGGGGGGGGGGKK